MCFHELRAGILFRSRCRKLQNYFLDISLRRTLKSLLLLDMLHKACAGSNFFFFILGAFCLIPTQCEGSSNNPSLQRKASAFSDHFLTICCTAIPVRTFREKTQKMRGASRKIPSRSLNC